MILALCTYLYVAGCALAFLSGRYTLIIKGQWRDNTSRAGLVLFIVFWPLFVPCAAIFRKERQEA